MGWLAKFTNLVEEFDHSRSAYDYKPGTKRHSAAHNELYWAHRDSARANHADDNGDRRGANEAREDARLTRRFALSLREQGE